jgi:hypothetical protein
MKKVLSREKSPIDDAIAAGAVPLLAKLLENDDTPATQFEAAWALTNIASGTTDHTACIVNTPGLISSFVRLLVRRIITSANRPYGRWATSLGTLQSTVIFSSSAECSPS